MSAIARASIIVFASVVFFLGIVPNFIVPEVAPDYVEGRLSKDWYANLIGVPAEVIEWPNVVWYTALPLIGSIVIIYGLLEEMRIFRGAANSEAVYIVIAAAWSFLLIRTGFLGSLATFIYQAGALLGIIIFTFSLMVGTILAGLGGARRRWKSRKEKKEEGEK